MLDLRVPRALRTYQKYMGGVDRNDQMRESGGGFAKGIRRYNRWFKTPIFAVQDIGMVNASIAWNMMSETDKGIELGIYRSPLDKFQTVPAHDMLNWDEEEIHNMQTRQQQGGQANSLHLPSHEKLETKQRPSCPVCKLELHMKKKKNVKDIIGSGYRNKTSMVKCTQCKGNFCLHWMFPKNSNSKIFNLSQFDGMSCFELFYSDEAKGLWSISEKGIVSPCIGHSIYKTLVQQWENDTNYPNTTDTTSTTNQVTPQTQGLSILPPNTTNKVLEDNNGDIVGI